MQGLKLDEQLAIPPSGFSEAPARQRRSAASAEQTLPDTANAEMQREKKAAAVKNHEGAGAAAGNKADGAHLGSWRQLPESLRRDIPAVSISGYIYTPDPAGRSAVINNRLLREGDQVAPGLMLERLLPKSAILNYQGTRYLQDY